MWKVALRPRWIAALALALAVAAAFAALGQWQLERSIATGTIVERASETVLGLNDIARPQSAVTEASNGQMVEVDGAFVPGDYILLSERLNQGESGYWVVGHLSSDGAGLAVALGWAATEDEALDALRRLDRRTQEDVTVVGRHLNSEAPQETDFENGELSSLSTATIVNLWNTVDDAGVFGGYLVSADVVEGLDIIDSPVPINETQVNWLNIFYAAEWVVFAGFAIFLWYRLVKDAWEAEEREKAELN